MTIRTFLLPDLGEGLTEAEIVQWLVAAGDTVAVDQPIVEVETAKAAVEVPCPFAGTVTTLHAEADTALAVGAPLISVEEGLGAGPDDSTDVDSTDVDSAVDTAEDEGSGQVLVGYGTTTASSARRRRPRARSGSQDAAPAAPPSAAAPAAPSATSAPAAAPVTTEDTPPQAPRVINPLVRRLAREQGVDLATVRGTGPTGLIMRADVTAAATGTGAASLGVASTATAGVAASQVQPSSEVDDSTGLRIAGIERVTGMRKATAAAVARSRREIPEATVWVDVDVTPLQELRAELAARGDGKAPGLLAFASRFALAGLTRYPQLAQRFEEDAVGAQRIVSFDGINLGVAVQTDRGLVVPSIRGAHTMTTRQLQEELRRITGLARSGEATAQDLTGGTFTVNNYGVFGVDGSAAIIPHTQAAMLGMGRIVERGWGVDGELQLRKIMQLSLVFDHRICDGGTAGGFLRFVADCFEHPAGVLADV